MRLADWLTEKRVAASEFAERIDVDKSTVGRWIKGEGFPRWDQLPVISEATGGAVTANDFAPAGTVRSVQEPHAA